MLELKTWEGDYHRSLVSGESGGPQVGPSSLTGGLILAVKFLHLKKLLSPRETKVVGQPSPRFHLENFFSLMLQLLPRKTTFPSSHLHASNMHMG